ncbi:MAG: thioesterase domain-containing protein [Ekhidna sp.]
MPHRIIVTGSAGPGIASYKKEYLSSDNEFKEVLRSFGGMPEEVLSDDSLFNFFNPILRSDFQILEEFDLPNEYIKTDVLAIMGNNEKHASFIENWKKFSFGKVLVNHLEGGHFFINQHLNEIALEINHS